MTRLLVLLTALLITGCASQPTAMVATDNVVIVGDDPGGLIGAYIAKVTTAKQSGAHVQIVGNCASACTLWTSMPPDRICVGPNAAFTFHEPTPMAGENQDAVRDAARGVLLAYYPESVRKWVVRQGGLTSKLVTLSGAELDAIFRRCDS